VEFSAGRLATVQIVADNSRTSALLTVQRTQNLMEQYAQQTRALRLLARGINPSIVEAVSVEEIDVSTPQSQAFISSLRCRGWSWPFSQSRSPHLRKPSTRVERRS
jgi:hypothetical protein